jgi:hypothetical protein
VHEQDSCRHLPADLRAGIGHRAMSWLLLIAAAAVAAWLALLVFVTLVTRD